MDAITIYSQKALKAWLSGPDNFGGAKRDRTADLLHAMQALSQLSYSPTSVAFPNFIAKHFTLVKVFGGAKRDRTADLLHAMQALSQLSYSPNQNWWNGAHNMKPCKYCQRLTYHYQSKR